MQSNLDLERLLSHHRAMCRIREFERAAIRALEAGDVPGPLHPSIGQEAAAVGMCTHLREDDILLSTHRGHGHTLVKGAVPGEMMRELLGRDGGCCAGKGGSMHIADFGVGMLGANGVVGANILIAAGAAHAIRLRGESRVVMCIFGDGAINRGPFLEGLNWAAVYDLPVIFVCEDNTFAATTRSGEVTGGGGPAARARSLGLPAIEADGNDVVALDALAADTINAVRAGSGPRFLHLRTYRLTGHTAADRAPYRSQAEVDAAWEVDPIARLRALLLDSAVAGDRIDAIESGARAEMEAVLDEARAAPWPRPARAWEDVQDLAPDPVPG